MQNFRDLVQMEHFQMGSNEGGRKICFFSTENWPYLANGERYSQGYY